MTPLGAVAIAGWSTAGVLVVALGISLWRSQAIRSAANVVTTQYAASDNEVGKRFAEEPLLLGVN
jgi:hypothetical protein